MKQDFPASTRTVPAPVPVRAPPIRTDSHELELKFLTTDAGFKAAQQWPALRSEPARRAQRLRSIYFDTPNADLERHRITLRIRNQRRGYVMTLKWQGSFSGGLFERGEIEIPSVLDQPDISLFDAEIAAMLAGLIQDQILVKMFATDIRRKLRRITSGSSDIEVAFDSGQIIAGSRELPVREIELELKSGDPAELYRQGIALAESYPVRLGTQGKSTRGALLAGGGHPGPVRAGPPLSGAPTVDAAIASIINGCIGQFTGNWPGFEDGDAVAAIHQMRVALRRLRAMLGLFQRAFPSPEFLAFRENAKQIAGVLGEARNWDVFLQLLQDGPAAAFPEVPGFDDIVAQSQQLRAAGYERVRERLAAAETTRFVLSLQAFVARHGWRNAGDAQALSRLTEPAKTFAATNLNRMHVKLTKHGKNLGGLAPHKRHQIRIELKKLRYAVDLFAGLFASGRLTDHRRITAKLQDQLGSFNDLITAHEMAARLDNAVPATHYAAGIITGWCGRGARLDDKNLAVLWKKFRKLK